MVKKYAAYRKMDAGVLYVFVVIAVNGNAVPLALAF